MVWTSLRLGTLWKRFSPSLSRQEAKMGSVAFFEPLTSTSPINLSPPLMTILSISNPQIRISCFRNLLSLCLHNSLNSRKVFDSLRPTERTFLVYHGRDPLSLTLSNFQEKPAFPPQIRRALGNNASIKFHSIFASIQGHGGFIILDLPRQILDL